MNRRAIEVLVLSFSPWEQVRMLKDSGFLADARDRLDAVAILIADASVAMRAPAMTWTMETWESPCTLAREFRVGIAGAP